MLNVDAVKAHTRVATTLQTEDSRLGCHCQRPLKKHHWECWSTIILHAIRLSWCPTNSDGEGVQRL